jgi:predicted AAA+ superfamily ATPase
VSFATLRAISFQEFLMALGDQKSLDILENLHIPEIVHEHLWEQLKRYFVVGGLPEVVATYCEHKGDLFAAFSKVREKQDDLIKAYYADIAKHSGKINAMHIDRVFHAVPTQMAQTIDGSVGRFKFRGVIPGITHYDRIAGAIDWLEAAGLIIKVPIVNTAHLPLKGYAKESFFKLMPFDVGILGSMSGLSPKTILDYEYGSYKGFFAENFVAQELLSTGVENFVCWQENKSEVEFITEVEGKIIPIEVKSGAVTKAKSLQLFAEKYHPPYSVILSGKPLHLDKKIHYYPLYLAGKFPL